MTTAPAIDERLHADAIKDLVNAQLLEVAGGSTEADTRCWDFDGVPGTTTCDDEDRRKAPLPDIYLQAHVERRYIEPQRMAGARSGRSSWRTTVRATGRNVAEARWALLQATRALDEQRFTVDGHLTTALRFESSAPVELDDRRYSGSITWTYSA